MVLKRVYVSTSESVRVIYNLSKELLDSLLFVSCYHGAFAHISSASSLF